MASVERVKDHLKRLSQLCDTGFALAIHIRYTRPSLLYQTYSREWMDFYSENGLMLSDPIVHWGLQNTGTILWSEITLPDEAGVIAASRRFGLDHGVTHATGPATSRTIAGLTRSARPFTEEEVAEMCGIVDALHDETEGMDRLPAAELDALRRLL